MYYCILCGEIHHSNYKTLEMTSEWIFKTGFRYINDTLYSAGVCQQSICASQPAQVQVQSATA
ncbi:DUF3973 domain-containing protein [Paenibacillus cremeus]|uniref:DUF3973 domain-containing protein n=1 Tax=Paenibacillus cremeus TaxID=2163881 RepID=A0A559K9G4_9BACL|nr:DUF3973 domain-containing protein [Paenibacillus cremeus]TVY08766.1 hypothetical protein FPZ49_17090 [Paenibacillus cremeus]